MSINDQFNPPLPLETLVDRIRAFKIDSINEKKRLIQELVRVHPLLNVQWGTGWSFRRVRELNPGQVVERVADVIWREGVPTRPGRANAEGYPVFYLADRRDTALRETRIEDSRVAVAEFMIRPGKQIRIYPIGELIQIQRTGRGFLIGDVSAALNDAINTTDREQMRSIMITDGFLLDCLTSHDDYEISAYVARCVFEKLPKITAISYSSRRQFSALCFAVKTETFWENWGLSSVTIGQAKHLAQGFYDFRGSLGVSGVTNGGDFVLSDDLSHEEARMTFSTPWYPVEFNE